MIDLSRYLSDREIEVVQLAAEGHSTWEIAKSLGISPKTIDTHLRHAYIRLGVGNRTELMRVVLGFDPVPEKAKPKRFQVPCNPAEPKAKRLRLMVAQYCCLGYFPYQIAEILKIREAHVKQIQSEINKFCRIARSQAKVA